MMPYIKYKIVLAFIVLMGLVSDNEALFGQTQVIHKDVIKTEIERTNTWPAPSRYLHGIPIYEKFDQLEAIFHFDNDTTYIINFWATWCKPCVEELPYFEALTAQNEGKNVKIILCSLDFPNQLENKLIPFIQEHQLKSTVIVLLDGKFNNWIDKVSPEWSGSIPASIVYKGKKRQFSETAFKDKLELESFINSL